MPGMPWETALQEDGAEGLNSEEKPGSIAGQAQQTNLPNVCS